MNCDEKDLHLGRHKQYSEGQEKMKQALATIDSLDLKRIFHMWEALLNNMAMCVESCGKSSTSFSMFSNSQYTFCGSQINMSVSNVANNFRKYGEAITYHKKVLALRPRNASTFSTIRYNYLLMFEFEKAVEYFHKSLSIRKNDTFTKELLTVAIDELVGDLSANVQGKYIM